MKGAEMGGKMKEDWPEKKRMIKEILKRLHGGESVDGLKEEFKEFLETVTAREISLIEQELIDEGMPREEMQRLCDVHLAVFKESVEGGGVSAPAGHPIGILMNEHRAILESAEMFRKAVLALRDAEKEDEIEGARSELARIKELLRDSESHYLREENVLFPYLEKHGITQPPAIMWMEHDRIRETKKKCIELIDVLETIDRRKEEKRRSDTIHELANWTIALSELLSNHFYKENNILFKAAMQVVTDEEWRDARIQFDEIGYCCFTPKPAAFSSAAASSAAGSAGHSREAEKGAAAPADRERGTGEISFETGSFEPEELEALLDTLPFDVTFVDAEDRVKYFSNAPERIFVRTKAVIGRTVQQCHPSKSIDRVNQILEDFKSGKRDSAEFWIEMNGRLIYIRYFAVRSKRGEYLGTVEVTQDITDIKGIEGEKRLM